MLAALMISIDTLNLLRRGVEVPPQVLAIALEANKGDDGGTCNFDTCERGLDPLFVTAKARRR